LMRVTGTRDSRFSGNRGCRRGPLRAGVQVTATLPVPQGCPAVPAVADLQRWPGGDRGFVPE